MKPTTARKIGIGHGADDLGLEVFLMLGEVGDALEHVFEEAAFLAGADHADGQLVERLGMRAMASARLVPSATLARTSRRISAQGRAGALPFEDVEAAQQRHAGAQQVGQLRVERRHVPGP